MMEKLGGTKLEKAENNKKYPLSEENHRETVYVAGGCLWGGAAFF